VGPVCVLRADALAHVTAYLTALRAAAIRLAGLFETDRIRTFC
jgi:hypothetical protein